MTGSLVRWGVSSVLEAFGVDEESANFLGRVIGGAVAIATFDVVSISIDASVALADGAVTSAELHASLSA